MLEDMFIRKLISGCDHLGFFVFKKEIIGRNNRLYHGCLVHIDDIQQHFAVFFNWGL